MSAPLLVADSIAKRFKGRTVLTAASLRAVPGSWRVLLGRNGSGKSTLLKIAVGLLDPDGGSVRFDGDAREYFRLPWLAARGVFFLPDRDLLSRRLTVRAQLEAFARRFRSGADIGSIARLLSIEPSLDRTPSTLSAGNSRSADLAAALVRFPRVLIADEPYRGLSPLDAARLTNGFHHLTSIGCAVVITGHEITTFLDDADHVTWCTAGTTYELGPPHVAREDASFRRAYLGFDDGAPRRHS